MDPLLLPFPHRTIEHGGGAVAGGRPAESRPDSFHLVAYGEIECEIED